MSNTTATFKFSYNPIARRPNPMRNLNPLARASAKRVPLASRVDQLEDSAVWQKNINRHKRDGSVFALSDIAKIAYVKLGLIIIDEDIQRRLDEKHCANKIGGELFDPRYLSPLVCIKTSTGEFISIDTQHSSTTLASLISAGMFVDENGNVVEDWRELEYPCSYVETDDLAFARKSFGILNGKGKLRQSKFQELRTSVFCVRIDNNRDDEEDVTNERKVQIAERHGCYPVEQLSALAKYPGTFTHISLFVGQPDEVLETAFSWHDSYFHQDTVHASLFPLFRDIVRDFNSAKLKFTAKLAEELAALVQSVFGDLEQFGQSAMNAQRDWSRKRYGYETNWSDDMYASTLFQLYVMAGGKEEFPQVLIDKHYDPKTNRGIADFLDADIVDLVAEVA